MDSLTTTAGGRHGSSSSVQREAPPHSLFEHSSREKSTQAGDGLRLRSNQVAESRSTTGNDLEQYTGHHVRAGRLVFRRSNGIQRALTPRVVLRHPLRGDLSVIHHGRVEKSSFGH